MHSNNEYTHTGRDTYQICVLGYINLEMEDVLDGMKITHIKTKRNSITSLRGKLEDKDALNSLIGRLVDLNYTVFSLNNLTNSNKTK